ncbi:transposon Ty3-G Gag-Pol polyprotein [Trichonephila clavipes]|nr:transposon Ty3-G Gag-Pol polyprotein [Trichonephila clavipes]
MARIVRHNDESVREGYIKNGGVKDSFCRDFLSLDGCSCFRIGETWTEKPDVNSLWIAEQTSRSSLGQKRKVSATQYKLYAANGTEIPTYGLKILTLDLGLRRPFQWPFIIAKVKRGIIGADFLQKFQLLIDLHNRKLIDGVTNLSIKGEVATIQENNDLSTVNRASKYFNLLNSYPDLTKPNLVNRVVKHGVKHHILTTGQPVYSKAKQLAPDKLKLATQEFQFMLDNDIIRPSKSQWASPLH